MGANPINTLTKALILIKQVPTNFKTIISSITQWTHLRLLGLIIRMAMLAK